MKKHFYSHLVEIESLHIELNTLDLSEDEKKHLIFLVESSIHHVVIDAILTELSEDEKKQFLIHLSKNDHTTIWNHLRSKIENIEEKIKKATDDLKRDLHKDIHEMKK